jgi:hypothetical protein
MWSSFWTIGYLSDPLGFGIVYHCVQKDSGLDPYSNTKLMFPCGDGGRIWCLLPYYILGKNLGDLYLNHHHHHHHRRRHHQHLQVLRFLFLPIPKREASMRMISNSFLHDQLTNLLWNHLSGSAKVSFAYTDSLRWLTNHAYQKQFWIRTPASWTWSSHKGGSQLPAVLLSVIEIPACCH